MVMRCPWHAEFEEEIDKVMSRNYPELSYGVLKLDSFSDLVKQAKSWRSWLGLKFL